MQSFRPKRLSWRLALALALVRSLLSSDVIRPCLSLSLPSRGAAFRGPKISPLSAATGAVRSVSEQYRLRSAADPDFARKSVVEAFLAAGTQLVAEANRRGGPSGLAREADFVFAGVLTAVVGKYYSMWRVAPTADPEWEGGSGAAPAAGGNSVVVASVDEGGETAVAAAQAFGGEGSSFWSSQVPTNAFQPYLLDGQTRPTVIGRLAALVAPVPSLFRAGIAASAIGYGLTALLIRLRARLMPEYVAQTVAVNLVHACLYTGGFVALVSNLRYQLLQGVVEPRIIDRALGRWPKARAVAIFAVRYANGLLGSILAIMGMRWMGLQKMKA